MKIKDLATALEDWAPLAYAESYDNAGLITGHLLQEISGLLICLDSTEEVIDEAIRLGCNVVIAHHPIVFKGLKKFNGTNYVERAIIKAIKNDIAIYAIHTNLDNIATGVNHQIAEILGLQNQQILAPHPEAGDQITGAGLVGTLDQPIAFKDFLHDLKRKMSLPLIKHTAGTGKPINKVALCGGAGSFLISAAKQSGADVYITSDLKYHEYFEADQSILLMDIGHFESERFTIDLIAHYIRERFPALPIGLTTLTTNPVQYFI